MRHTLKVCASATRSLTHEFRRWSWTDNPQGKNTRCTKIMWKSHSEMNVKVSERRVW